MKRPGGVTVAAVILVLGSLLLLLIAVIMAASAMMVRNLPAPAGATTTMPVWMPTMMSGVGLFYLLLAVWGIWSAIGLFRLRKWARYSVLVIGGLLAVFGLGGLLIALAVLAMNLPLPQNGDPAQLAMAHTMLKVFKAVGVFFYAAMSGLGIWLLAYFNFKSTRAAFGIEVGEAVKGSRPMLISVVAVLSILGAVVDLMISFLPLPGFFFGLIAYGWVKTAVYLCFGVGDALAGVWLWQMKERGRWLKLAYVVVTVVMMFFDLLNRTALVRYTSEIYKRSHAAASGPMWHMQLRLEYGSILLAGIYLIVMGAVLVYYRNAFEVDSLTGGE